MVVIRPREKEKSNLAWRSKCGKFILCKTVDRPGAKINNYLNANYSVKRNGINKLLYGIDTILALKELGFRLRIELREAISFLNKDSLIKLKPIKVKGMSLYPFQEEGLALLEYFNGRALLADEMGLGKTIQAIAYLKINPEIRPALIVCPNCVKDKWKEEIEKYDPDAVIETISGKKASNLPKANYYIINYDIISSWKVKIRNRTPKIIIMDECHMIKNSGDNKNKVARTAAVKSIAKKCDYILGLSGTPILSRPLEVYNTVNLINPELFAGKQSFGMRYCDGKRGYIGWDFNGASNEAELNTLLKNTCLIRRLKKEVLSDLPAEPLPNIINLRLTNQSEYNRAQNDIIAYLKQVSKDKAERAKKAKHLVRLEHLKQLACKGKMKSVCEWIENTLSQVNKLVVFAWHQEVIDILHENFKKIAIVPRKHGTSHECATRFNNDPKIKLFIGNIKADGAGIDLVSAADLVFIEYAWTPGDMDQARDRIYRIGQKNKRLNLTYLVGKDTIDNDIIEILSEKRKTVSSIVDGKVASSQDDIFKDLVRRLLRK